MSETEKAPEKVEETSLEETSTIPEPRFDPEEEDFDTKVGRWQNADSLRRMVKTATSDVYYFERNDILVMKGLYRLERRDKDDEGNHVTQFRALPVDAKG